VNCSLEILSLSGRIGLGAHDEIRN
jgi:hypothetical protein